MGLQHAARAVPVAAVLVADALQQLVAGTQRLAPRLPRRQLLAQVARRRDRLLALALEARQRLEHLAPLVQQPLPRLLGPGRARGGVRQRRLLGRGLGADHAQALPPVLLLDRQLALQALGRVVGLDEGQVQLRGLRQGLPAGLEADGQLLQRLLAPPHLLGRLRELGAHGLEARAEGGALRLDLAPAAPRRRDRRLDLGPAPLLLADAVLEGQRAALGLLELLLEGPQGVLQPAPLRLALLERGPRRLDPRPQLGQLAGVGLGQHPQLVQAAAQLLLAPAELAVLLPRQEQVERADLLEQALVAAGLADLARQRPHLAADLVHQVAQPQQVLLGLLELALGLAAPRLVLGDARALLEQVAQLLGVLVEDLVDHGQLDDRVGRVVDAAVVEEVAQVLQADGAVVQEVLAEAVALHAPLDGDLVELHGNAVVVVGEGDRDLGQADRLALGRPLEDDVLHALAAQLLGGLLAEDPADGVDDVGLAAAVRAQDRGDPLVEGEGRALRERFESEQLHPFQLHASPSA